MAFRMRTSKFRHVFGSPYKKEHCYECIPITKNAHDSNFCAVNPKFIAVVTESTGGGAFVIIPVEKSGRVDVNSCKVCGHSGPVLDIKWNPFNDNVIASCSDDATIKIWEIPDEGLTSNLSDWQVDLHGHTRRVGFIEWHPTAENLLLSAGYDYKCILWNTETAEPIQVMECHTDTIFSISWNRDGSLFASTSKDKKIRVINPRDGTVIAEGKGHLGPKASKVVFLQNNKLFTTGFSRHSERQCAVWDCNKLNEPLKLESIDSSSGVLFPYYDPDTNVVFMAGKGDGNIRYYEVADTAPYLHKLNQYQSASPQRGLGFMPKRGVDPKKCEIVRFYKLHTIKNWCEPVSMIVPRKSEMFQDDLYPPTASSCPSLTADEWLSGIDRAPILISLKDGTVSKAPTITTYKAVRPPTAATNGHSAGAAAKTPMVNSAAPRTAAEPNHHQHNNTVTNGTSDGKLPQSLMNINKLSTSTATVNGVGVTGDRGGGDGDRSAEKQRSDSIIHLTQADNVNNRIAAFERKNHPSSPAATSAPTQHLQSPTMHANTVTLNADTHTHSNTGPAVEKKMWSQSKQSQQSGNRIEERTTYTATSAAVTQPQSDPELMSDRSDAQSDDLFNGDRTWNSTLLDESLDDLLANNDHLQIDTDDPEEEKPSPGIVKRRSASLEQNMLSPTPVPTTPTKRLSHGEHMMSPPAKVDISAFEHQIHDISSNKTDINASTPVSSPKRTSLRSPEVSPYKTPIGTGHSNSGACSNAGDENENSVKTPTPTTPASSQSTPFSTPVIEPASWHTNPIYGGGSRSDNKAATPPVVNGTDHTIGTTRVHVTKGSSTAKVNGEIPQGTIVSKTEKFELKSKQELEPPLKCGKTKITRTSSERIKNWQSRIDQFAQNDEVVNKRPASIHVLNTTASSKDKEAGAAVSINGNKKAHEVNNNSVNVSQGNGVVAKNSASSSDVTKVNQEGVNDVDSDGVLEDYTVSAPDDTLIKPSILRESLRRGKKKQRPTILPDKQEPKVHKLGRSNKYAGRYKSDLGPLTSTSLFQDQSNAVDSKRTHVKNHVTDSEADLSAEIDNMLSDIERQHNAAPPMKKRSASLSTPEHMTYSSSSTLLLTSSYDNVKPSDLDSLLNELNLDNEPQADANSRSSARKTSSTSLTFSLGNTEASTVMDRSETSRKVHTLEMNEASKSSIPQGTTPTSPLSPNASMATGGVSHQPSKAGTHHPKAITTVSDAPQTEQELRRAYFQQVEEIKSLKEQISLKDHRIRQLEEELDLLRSDVGGEVIGESSC